APSTPARSSARAGGTTGRNRSGSSMWGNRARAWATIAHALARAALVLLHDQRASSAITRGVSSGRPRVVARCPALPRLADPPTSSSASIADLQPVNSQPLRHKPPVDPQLLLGRALALVGARRVEVEREPALVAPVLEQFPVRRDIAAARAEVLVEDLLVV